MLNQPKSGLTRIPYTQRCRLRHGEKWQSGILCNISVHGVYVTLEAAPDVGEMVELSFLLPGGDEPVETSALVTWQNLDEPERADGLPPGCGLKFASLGPADRARIEALVSEHKSRLPMGVGAAALCVPYLQRCQVTVGGQLQQGVVCNLSTLGVYVTLDPIPELGERVGVSFRLPGETRLFECDARVTWQGSQVEGGLPPGCRLRFDDLPPDEFQRIERVLLDYCSDLTRPE